MRNSVLTKLIGALPAMTLVFSAAGSSLRSAPAGGREETVFPKEIQEPVNNPYMGWGIWAGSCGFGNDEKQYTVQEVTTGFGDDAPLFSWVLLDWDWASIEPQEGQHNWGDFDRVVQYWGSRGKQIVFRPWVTDNPGWAGRPGRKVLPDWIWSKGVRYREYTGNGGSTVRELDYLDPSYQEIYLPLLRKLLESFAAHYDKPGTPIIMVQVMGYGHWADWGTWYSHYPFPTAKAEHDLLTKIIDVYSDTLHDSQLLLPYNPEWNLEFPSPFQIKSLHDLVYSKALDVGLERNFAFIRTGFIDRLRFFDRDFMEAYWRQAPLIAEGNWNYDDMKDQLTHGTLAENLKVMLEYHSNYAHFYFLPATYKRAIRQDRAFLENGLVSGALGYRLVLGSAAWSAELPAGDLLLIDQKWVNRSVGRLYVAHPLKLYLTDNQGNEKFSDLDTTFNEATWVQGETYTLTSVFHPPKKLASGVYDMRIALVDPAGNPRIKLAIDGRDSLGRYRLGTIRILPPEGKAACDQPYCP